MHAPAAHRTPATWKDTLALAARKICSSWENTALSGVVKPGGVVAPRASSYLAQSFPGVTRGGIPGHRWGWGLSGPGEAAGLSGPGGTAVLSGPGEAAWGSCWALGPGDSRVPGKLLGSRAPGKLPGEAAGLSGPREAASGSCWALSPKGRGRARVSAHLRRLFLGETFQLWVIVWLAPRETRAPGGIALRAVQVPKNKKEEGKIPDLSPSRGLPARL